MKLYKGTVYERKESQYWEGDVPLKVADDTPTYTWKGPKMPVDFLYPFFGFALANPKREVQARIFLNPNKATFHYAVYPQFGAGSTTTEDADDVGGINKARKHLPKGAIQVGDIHSHPGFSAFASGTDKADAVNGDGLHLTVGWSTKKDHIELELFGITSCYGQVYSMDLNQWFFVPGFEKQPSPIHEAAIKYWSVHPTTLEFPKQWQEKLKERQYATGAFDFAGTGWGRHCTASPDPVRGWENEGTSPDWDHWDSDGGVGESPDTDAGTDADADDRVAVSPRKASR